LKEADPIDTSFAGPLAPARVRYLPGEDVLLLAVDMPAMSASQRRNAVAFAVEDQIASPLDDVHVVLGPNLAESGRWLVAVVARDVLAGTTADRKTRLIPDTLALPVPQDGHWSVWTSGNRVLVRTPDGAGFATNTAALPIFHLVAGHPGIVLYSGTLDAQYGDIRPVPLPARPEPALDRLDLNGARNTRHAFIVPRTWARIAAVLAVAAVAHIGLLIADTWALGQVRTARQMDVRGVLDALGQPAGSDIDAAITQTLARTNGTGGPRVIPMMSQTFATLAAQAGHVTLSDLRYSADQGSLTLTLQAPDIVTLQSVEVALTDAGFRVTVGAATTAGGLAEQQLILQGAGS
jgi:general secretion pathway protein L